MHKLPDYHTFKTYPKTPLKSLFTAASSDALDLLDKMLQYDPFRRVSCDEVLSTINLIFQLLYYRHSIIFTLKTHHVRHITQSYQRNKQLKHTTMLIQLLEIKVGQRERNLKVLSLFVYQQMGSTRFLNDCLYKYTNVHSAFVMRSDTGCLP